MRTTAFILACMLSLVGNIANSNAESTTTVYQSTSGFAFKVNPAFLPAIQSLIETVRGGIADAKDKTQYVAYLSVPISPRGGGDFTINTEIAAATAKALQNRFGQKLFVVDPAAYNLPPIGESKAGGGEYMAVWSDVLAGKDGKGNVFDMVYFAGPRDIQTFFKVDGEDSLGDIESWIDQRSQIDQKFRDKISEGKNRWEFIRYYGIRASTVYSKGAHDEWNIIRSLNSNIPIGSDIAIYYNGIAIEMSDYEGGVDIGYQHIP